MAMGHAEGAAGISGLLKLILAVQRGKVPAHLHLQKENPHLSLERARARVPSETVEWNAGASSRIGGVSSFGFSGTNVHVIVEQAPQQPADVSEPAREHLCVFSAKGETALLALAQAHATNCTSVSSLSDAC